MPEVAAVIVAVAALVVWLIARSMQSHPRHRGHQGQHRPGGASGPGRELVRAGAAPPPVGTGEAPTEEIAVLGRVAASAVREHSRALARKVPAATPPPGAGPTTGRGGRTRLFAHATRTPGGYAHRGPYAAIGITTTGFSPAKDRIIEIAVVRLDATGRVVDEWATLLSAQGRPVGLGFLHGLASSDLEHAPAFADIAAHLLRLLQGCVVVAHHGDLLEEFLAASFLRAGVLAPSLPTLCTFRWAQLTFATRNYRLATLADRLGLPRRPGTSANEDARTVAGLLPRVLAAHGTSLRYPIPPAPVLPGRPAPPPQTRRGRSPGEKVAHRWVSELLANVSMSAREANDPRAAVYVEALASVLGQGRIVTDEARELARLMAAAGYPASDIRGMLERLLESLREAAFASTRRLSSAQLRHLRAIATSVGVPSYFDDLIPPPRLPAPEPGSGSFARPVRKPPPPPPAARVPRCGHCLAVGHYTSACPRLGGRRSGPVAPVSPIEPI